MTDSGHKLGEVLRTAREAKGADLGRVERETKIRERYLSALERGEYRELPGSVYTKGFLRNYAAYLGLDPEYLIDLYRLETATAASERASVPGPPRPMSVRRRRTFVVTPGAVAAAILTVLVGAFVAWLGYEFVNFARTPELRIIEPAGDVSAHTGSTITVRGVTAPNATITISGLPENPTATADANGNFAVDLRLLPGSNEIHLVAHDPVTRRPSEEFIRRVNVIGAAPSSPPGVADTVLTSPEAGSTVTGPLAVAGTTAGGTTVTVTATFVSAAEPSFAIVDAAGDPVAVSPPDPGNPEPSTLDVGGSETFSTSLELAPGTWEVAVSAEGGTPVVRQVTIEPGAGLSATVRLEGGESYLELEEDGKPVAGRSGTIVAAGESVGLTAQRTIRIRAGNAGALRVSVNGLALGPMGNAGDVVEWQITRTGG